MLMKNEQERLFYMQDIFPFYIGTLALIPYSANIYPLKTKIYLIGS